MNMDHVKVEANHLEFVWLYFGSFRRYDPLGLVKENFNLARFSKPCVYKKNPFDSMFTRVESYVKVKQRINSMSIIIQTIILHIIQ